VATTRICAGQGRPGGPSLRPTDSALKCRGTANGEDIKTAQAVTSISAQIVTGPDQIVRRVAVREAAAGSTEVGEI
jgi:hypothetical protein